MLGNKTCCQTGLFVSDSQIFLGLIFYLYKQNNPFSLKTEIRGVLILKDNLLYYARELLCVCVCVCVQYSCQTRYLQGLQMMICVKNMT